MTLTGLIINGQELEGIKALQYTAKSKAEILYEQSHFPSVLTKNTTVYEGKIVLNSSSFEALEQMASDQEGIIGLEHIEMLATYESSDGQMHYDVLEDCFFTEVEKFLAQQEEIVLPFVARKIQYRKSL